MPVSLTTSVAVALAIAVSAAATAADSAAPTPKGGLSASVVVGATCPVTRPGKALPPGVRGDAAGFNYGSERLRAQLYWPGGTLSAGILADGGSLATINADGSISAKLGWWVRDVSKLMISGRRLDGPATPLRASVPSGYGPAYSLGSSLGFQPTRLTFPTRGCWRVVGRAGSARLTFVVRVISLKSAVR